MEPGQTSKLLPNGAKIECQGMDPKSGNSICKEKPLDYVVHSQRPYVTVLVYLTFDREVQIKVPVPDFVGGLYRCWNINVDEKRRLDLVLSPHLN